MEKIISTFLSFRTFNEEEEDIENEERDATESDRHRASVSEISSLLQPSTTLAGNQGIPQEVSTVIVTTNHNSAIRDLLTCLALSLHAVFEGLAVGLAADNVSMWALCAGTTQLSLAFLSFINTSLQSASVKRYFN